MLVQLHPMFRQFRDRPRVRAAASEWCRRKNFAYRQERGSFALGDYVREALIKINEAVEEEFAKTAVHA